MKLKSPTTGKLNQLYITDEGDPSVGLFRQTWEIDCPFDIYACGEIDKLEFAKDCINVFIPYCDGKISWMYSSELEDI